MSVPIGRVDGLPVGGQLIANHFDERQMFVAAYALERALGAGAHQ
jgi:aspartyl-tRNA(Asn)/glutamyl-tRNA(Gln) amidotransferase subunit A